MRVPHHPRLYGPAAEDPVLNGVECSHCGRVYFPPIGIGCEICGALEDQLSPKLLTATGVVYAVAAVFVSPTTTKVPFTVAEIVLDDGPLIRAMIHPESADVSIGDRVVARWSVIDHNGEGSEIVEPGFVLAAPTVAATA